MALIKMLRIHIAIASLFFILIAASCDCDIEAVSLELVGVPDRVVYIAGVDTEIDLSGLRFVSLLRDGRIMESSLADWKDPEHEPGRLVYHEIDFAIPGVYEVELSNRGYGYNDSFKFYIQVIDADFFHKEELR